MVNLSTPNDILFKELCDDYKKALYWHTKHYGGSEKYSKFQDSLLAEVMRTHKQKSGDVVEYNSKNGNRWLIFESCNWYPDSQGAHTAAHAFCYYETYASIGAFRLLGDGDGNLNGVLIFTSHFFERFCERLELENMTGKVRTRQIVKNFIEYFPALVMKVYERSEKDHLIHIDLRTSGSLARGILREGGSIPVYEVRSFLCDKQLNNKQLRETTDIRIKADKVRKYEPEQMRNTRLMLETQRDGLLAVCEREMENVTNLGVPKEIAEKSLIAGISILNAMLDDNLADSMDLKFWGEHGKRNADIINEYAIKAYSDKNFNAGAELIKLAAECIKKDNLQKKCHMKVIAKSILTKTFSVPGKQADEMIATLKDKI